MTDELNQPALVDYSCSSSLSDARTDEPTVAAAPLASTSPSASRASPPPSFSGTVTIPIVKGGMGFGFTIADSAFGQKVKKILDRPRCKNLNEGDILVEINQSNVRNMSHNEVVQVLKDCPRGQEAAITIQRGMLSQSPSKNKFKKKEEGNMRPKSGFLFRSKTPTAELFSTQEKEVVPMRPKTPIVDTRNMSQKSWDSAEPPVSSSATLSPFSRNDMTRASLGGSIRPSPGGHQAGHDRSADQQLADTMTGVTLTDSGQVRNNRSHSSGRDLDYNYSGYPNNSAPVSSANYNNYNSYNQNMGGQPGYNQYTGYNGYNNPVPQGYDPGYGYTGYSNDQGGYQGPGRGVPQMGYSPNNGNNMTNGYRSGSLPRSRKESTSFEQSEPVPTSVRWPGPRSSADRRWQGPEEPGQEITVTLLRHESGFGFRIVGGTEEGSQVSGQHPVICVTINLVTIRACFRSPSDTLYLGAPQTWTGASSPGMRSWPWTASPSWAPRTMWWSG